MFQVSCGRAWSVLTEPCHPWMLQWVSPSSSFSCSFSHSSESVRPPQAWAGLWRSSDGGWRTPPVSQRGLCGGKSLGHGADLLPYLLPPPPPPPLMMVDVGDRDEWVDFMDIFFYCRHTLMINYPVMIRWIQTKVILGATRSVWWCGCQYRSFTVPVFIR